MAAAGAAVHDVHQLHLPAIVLQARLKGFGIPVVNVKVRRRHGMFSAGVCNTTAQQESLHACCMVLLPSCSPSATCRLPPAAACARTQMHSGMTSAPLHGSSLT